jgi:UDP-N-acetyl-D-mannosaminuronic acid dehydrogenase
MDIDIRVAADTGSAGLIFLDPPSQRASGSLENNRTGPVGRICLVTRVVVIGLGYIGLPTAAMLALTGSEVIGVDIQPKVLEALRSGNPPVRERDLTAVVREAMHSGRLQVAERPEKADYFIICVPTPKNGQKAELGAVDAASRSIAPFIREGCTAILESTVPPGTSMNLVRPILERSGMTAGRDFHLAHCPERVMPGNILREIVENERIVGGIDPSSAQRAASLYSTFVRGTIHLTDLATAEFVKLAENAYRDVNIAFANELADLAEAHGVDIWYAISLANRHPRVNILRPGPGVGGHCLPVDPWFLLTSKVRARMIPASRETNDNRPLQVARKALSLVRGIKRPKIAALGIAFKGNADDIRESPAIEIIEKLHQDGATVAAYDPLVPNDQFSTMPLEEAIEGADLILILADHRELTYLDPEMIAPRVHRRILFDSRSAVDHRKWADAGFEVHILGNPRPILPKVKLAEVPLARTRSRK